MTKSKKLKYNQAPLPFQGQKRKFTRLFAEQIEHLPDDTVFVDLFGGSGLLSRAAKDTKPQSRVIYNDYDGYSKRITNISCTNKILAEVREILKVVPRYNRIDTPLKEKVLSVVEKYDKRGYVDYITISSSLLFSMKYALSFEELAKGTLYNNVKKEDYSLADGYLEGLEVRHSDYMDLFYEFKDNDKAFFICDPPYLATDVQTYAMSWRLKDYLHVLECLQVPQFAFFTSNKSSLIELMAWLSETFSYENPLSEAVEHRVRQTMNHTASYDDIMIIKIKTEWKQAA